MKEVFLGVVALANAAAVIALAAGILTEKAAVLRKALLASWVAVGLAAVGWLALPAAEAAVLRQSTAGLSADEKKVMRDSNYEVDPLYEPQTLLPTVYFLVVPIFAALVLRYRWVRPRERGE